MRFHPDPRKLAQEVLLSRKKKIQIYLTISLNNVQVEKAPHHKHLGILLDEKLNFQQHVGTTTLIINKGISIIKKLRHSWPRKTLITIYNMTIYLMTIDNFLTTLIDYGDITYDQPQNESRKTRISAV